MARARAKANWERLVRAALRGERLGGAYGQPVTGIAGNVPSSLGNIVHIVEVLHAADEMDEDPTVARILCEHAYELAQDLDPNSEGTGVLQFKTAVMSLTRQKLAKSEGGVIDRSQDISKLQEFYELIADEMKLRESAVFTGNLGELERETLMRKKVHATLKVLWSVIEDMTKDISPEKPMKTKSRFVESTDELNSTVRSLRDTSAAIGAPQMPQPSDPHVALWQRLEAIPLTPEQKVLIGEHLSTKENKGKRGWLCNASDATLDAWVSKFLCEKEGKGSSSGTEEKQL